MIGRGGGTGGAIAPKYFLKQAKLLAFNITNISWQIIIANRKTSLVSPISYNSLDPNRYYVPVGITDRLKYQKPKYSLKYSKVSNKRVGWNKCAGWKIPPKQGDF